MVGTYANAARALECFEAGNRDCLLSDIGSSRMVYLIDNVVYKVEFELGFNVQEVNRAKLFRDTPGVAVPDITLYSNNVLAMEYIPGLEAGFCNAIGISDCDCFDVQHMPEGLMHELMDIGWDCTMGNAIWLDGVYHIVDMAY